MLPFIGVAMVPLWDACRRPLRFGLLALAAVSFAVSLACATFYMTTPLVADGVGWVRDELFQFILPHFLGGDVHHMLAPHGNGGLLSLLWLLVPVLLEVAASGVVPMVLRDSQRRGQGSPKPA